VVKFKAQSKQSDAEQIARQLPAAGGKRSGNNLEDALEVGKRVTGLVQGLGLAPLTLTERGVGRDQIPIIVGRATGDLKEGPLYEEITRLVEGFF
jgi:hypothetical protein